MKNKLYYLLAVAAIAVGMVAKVDIRQSPPDPTSPFDPPCSEPPCTAARK